MADGKWVKDLTADMKVSDAARHVLEARYEVVQERLPLAVSEANLDPEHVHQLRVGTRRAGAALRIFADALPGKAYDKARRRLRKIRRAAGAARDWDVFSLALRERRQQVDAKEQAGLDFLIGYAAGQRAAAQEGLTKVGTHHGDRLKKRVEGLLDAVRQPDEPAAVTLGTLAGTVLRELLTELETAASGNLEDYEHLHQVRILGKQLRYAIEVFVECFDASLREIVYPQVEAMQEMLGLANDSHVAAQFLTAMRERLKVTAAADWKRYRFGVEGLLRFHQRRLPRERQHFVKWWGQWSHAAGRQLADMLHMPTAASGHRD